VQSKSSKTPAGVLQVSAETIGAREIFSSSRRGDKSNAKKVPHDAINLKASSRAVWQGDATRPQDISRLKFRV